MKLYRAFATVGGLTMVSRVLGFCRDILIAAALGSGAIADAFFVAFRFPNLFRRLFAEGAFNAAFVPLYGKHLKEGGDERARTFAEETLAVLLTTLVLFSIAAIAAMPWLMMLLAPGFVTDPEKYDLAVRLTQIAFPYLLCMSIVAMLSGILNSLQRFWLAAAVPILLNIILITAIVFALWSGYAEKPKAGYVLAIGVFIAGFAQLAALWIGVRRAGVRLNLRRPRLTDGVKRLVRLGIPGVISGGITQINIVVGTIIASLQAGAVSYLYYADRLYQLPLGIVGVAVGVVLLPELVRNLRDGDRTAVMDSQNRSLEFALMWTLPAAVALLLAAEPIIRVLFERGAFTPADTPATAWALAAFSIGLPAFVLIKVLQPAFFAREDTRTPMWFAGINLTVNVALSLILFFTFRSIGWMPHVGIALATSIAGWVNTLLLWRHLSKAGDFEPDPRLVKNLKSILLASALMGAVLLVAGRFLAPYLASDAGILTQVLALSAFVSAGIAVFAAAILATGVLRRDQIRRFLARSGS